MLGELHREMEAGAWDDPEIMMYALMQCHLIGVRGEGGHLD
jgi:hypothetical protein